jgi:uncharacterized membrane protein
MSVDAQDLSAPPPALQSSTSLTAMPTKDAMRTTVLVVHGLYALGMLTGITTLVGVILAYIKRADAQGTPYESHITYAIRTFWIGIGLIVSGIILTFVLVGTIVLALSTVWYLIRIVRAFVAALDSRPIANPKSFF